MTDIHRINRLRFRSWHRGTREMDLLMGSFADAYVASFDAKQMDDYEKILETNDPDLYNWITGLQSVPAAQDTEVMRQLCAHRFVR